MKKSVRNSRITRTVVVQEDSSTYKSDNINQLAEESLEIGKLLGVTVIEGEEITSQKRKETEQQEQMNHSVERMVKTRGRRKASL